MPNSKPLSFTQIQERFAALCHKIDPQMTPPTIPTMPTHSGYAHLEIVGQSYHWITTERGAELERRTTIDPDELLYWLIDEVSWSRALAYELAHRRRGESFRRLLFAKHVEYLERVSAAWAERKSAEYEALLTRFPFDDEAEG